MKTNNPFLIVCLGISLLTCLPLLAEVVEVGAHRFERRMLDNGMITLAAASTNETAAIYWAVDAGKRHESHQFTGLAHLTEHALFTGTEKMPGPAFEQRVRGMKGRANAFTREDYTLYYDVGIPLDRLEEVLAWEADRLRSLSFAPDSFAHEQSRLTEEEDGDDNVSERLHEWVDSLVFRQHPYGAGVRIDGHTMAPSLDLAIVQDFYQRYYQPNRVAMVVVANQPAVTSLDQIEAAFEHLPPSAKIAPIPPQPAPAGPVQATFATGLSQDRVEFVWQMPGLQHADHYALQVLASVLAERGQGRDALVRVALGDRLDGDHLRVWATGPAAEPTLGQFFAEALAQRVTPEEIKLAKQNLADDFLELGMHGRPYFSLPARIAQYEAIKCAGYIPGFASRINAVTLDEVQAALGNWLSAEKQITIRFKGTGKEIALPEDTKELSKFAADASESGKYEEAIAAYSRLLDKKPNAMFRVIYLASRGQVYLATKQYDEAIADFETAISLSEYPALPPLLKDAKRLKAGARARVEEDGAE